MNVRRVGPEVVTVEEAWALADAERERERVVFLSVVRGACLSDHMGDMWNTLIEIAKLLDIEMPEDDDGIDLDAVEKMGGRGIWAAPKLADYLGSKP